MIFGFLRRNALDEVIRSGILAKNWQKTVFKYTRNSLARLPVRLLYERVSEAELLWLILKRHRNH